MISSHDLKGMSDQDLIAKYNHFRKEVNRYKQLKDGWGEGYSHQQMTYFRQEMHRRRLLKDES